MTCGAVGKWARLRGTKSKWWEFCLAGWGALSGGCRDAGTGDAPVPEAEYVPSRPGIVQVAGDDGPLLGERDACEQFRSAWQSNRVRLVCAGEQSLLECPALVRPLASMECVSYTLDSVTGCTEKFNSAERCEDLVAGACVLTAVVHVPSPECVSDADGSVVEDADVDSGESLSETSDTSTHPNDSGVLPGSSAETSGAVAEAGVDAGADGTTPGPSSGDAGTATPVELDANISGG